MGGGKDRALTRLGGRGLDALEARVLVGGVLVLQAVGARSALCGWVFWGF